MSALQANSKSNTLTQKHSPSPRLSMLLLLIYLSHSTSQGLTLPFKSTLKSEALYPRLGDEFFVDRPVWSIVGSCVVTLFACCWVAVHPNVPPTRDNQIWILGRRLAIMAYMLLTPELIIRWAAIQHFDAKAIAIEHKGAYPLLSDGSEGLTEIMVRRERLDQIPWVLSHYGRICPA